MLTWPDLNQTSKNNMLKKLGFQITKVSFFSFDHLTELILNDLVQHKVVFFAGLLQNV